MCKNRKCRWITVIPKKIFEFGRRKFLSFICFHEMSFLGSNWTELGLNSSFRIFAVILISFNCFQDTVCISKIWEKGVAKSVHKKDLLYFFVFVVAQDNNNNKEPGCIFGDPINVLAVVSARPKWGISGALGFHPNMLYFCSKKGLYLCFQEQKTDLIYHV